MKRKLAQWRESNTHTNSNSACLSDMNESASNYRKDSSDDGDGIILKSPQSIIRPHTKRKNINWSDLVAADTAKDLNETNNNGHKQRGIITRQCAGGYSEKFVIATPSVLPDQVSNQQQTGSDAKLMRMVANTKRKKFYSMSSSGPRKPVSSPTTPLSPSKMCHSSDSNKNNDSSPNYAMPPSFENSSAYLQQAVSSYEFLIELEKVILKQFSPLIENIVNTIDYNEKQTLEKKRMEEIADEWSDVARICDQILCYFFVFFTLGSCFFIFLVSPHFWSEW